MAGSRSVSSVQLTFAPAASDETSLEVELEIGFLAEVLEPPEEIEDFAQPLLEDVHATPAEVIEAPEYIVLPNAGLLDFAVMSVVDSTLAEETTDAKPHKTTDEVETHREKKTPAGSFSLAAAIATPTDVGLDPTSPAKPLHNPPPVYPAEAIGRGVEGRVVLRVAVASSGMVSSVRVATSSGDSALDQAAVDAVRRWKFEPARRDQQAVAWTALLPVRFRIH